MPSPALDNSHHWSASLAVSILILVCTLLLPMPLNAAEYFRYRNDTGAVVIDSILPPQFVKYGYEVINDKGLVLRTIAPQATEAEIQAKQQQREEQRRREEQFKKDTMLLTRYSSVADIEASQSRVVDEINVRLSILRANLRSLKAQIERQQEEAANAERAGREVPKRLLDNISTMEGEVDDTRKKIAARKKEITAVKRKYAADIERFEYLQERRYGKRSS